MQKVLLIILFLTGVSTAHAQLDTSTTINITVRASKYIFRSDRIPETSAAFSPDGQQLYFTREGAIFNFGKENAADIWKSKLKSDGTWQEPINVGPQLNTLMGEEVVSIHQEGKTIYFTRQTGDSTALYRAQLVGRRWSQPKKIHLYDQGSIEQVHHYFISADEKIMLLCAGTNTNPQASFLFYSLKNSLDQQWTMPRRVFIAGNQTLNIKSAFLATDNACLYFSTNNLPGKGGYDLFLSQRLGNAWYEWTEPKNLGLAINSSADEYGFSMASTGQKIAYISNINRGRTKIFLGEMPPGLSPAEQTSSNSKEQIKGLEKGLKKSIKN